MNNSLPTDQWSATMTSGALRFRIVHLLIFTGWTAVGMACLSTQRYYSLPGDELSESLPKLLRIPLVLADAVALTAFVVLLPASSSLARQQQLQPGHWILMAWAIQACGQAASNVATGWLNGEWQDYAMWYLGRGFEAIAHGSMILFTTLGAFWFRRERQWLVYFALRTIAAGLAVVLGILEVGMQIGWRCGWFSLSESVELFIVPGGLVWVNLFEFGAFVTILLAVTNDLKAKKPRDWLHYTGIALVLAYPFLSVIRWLDASLYYWLIHS